MAGADKKQHTRDYIEDIGWKVEQAFIYGYLEETELEKEIQEYLASEGYRFDDDLVPALIELHVNPYLKTLLAISEKVFLRFAQSGRVDIINEVLVKQSKAGDEHEHDRKP